MDFSIDPKTLSQVFSNRDDSWIKKNSIDSLQTILKTDLKRGLRLEEISSGLVERKNLYEIINLFLIFIS